MTLKKAFILGLNTMILSSAVMAKEPNALEIQERMLILKKNMESTLYNKSHILTKELTGKLEGSINGNLSGGFTTYSRTSSMIGKAVLGALALPAFALASPVLVGPMGLGSILGMSAVGAGGGAAIGALTPDKTGQGSINGSLTGKIKGENWENLKSSNSFVMTVIDPNQLQQINKLSNAQSTRSECVDQYEKSLKALTNSKRYVTQKEAIEFFDNASEFSELANDLEIASLKMTPVNRMATASFLTRMNEWRNKKVNVNLIGLNGVKFKNTQMIRVAPEIYKYFFSESSYFDNGKFTKTKLEPFIFTREEFTKDAANLVINRAKDATKYEYVKGAHTTIKGINDEGQLVTLNPLSGIKTVSNNRIAFGNIYIPMSVTAYGSIDMSSQEEACTSNADFEKVLNQISVSEDFLLDSVTKNTADNIFAEIK